MYILLFVTLLSLNSINCNNCNEEITHRIEQVKSEQKKGSKLYNDIENKTNIFRNELIKIKEKKLQEATDDQYNKLNKIYANDIGNLDSKLFGLSDKLSLQSSCVDSLKIYCDILDQEVKINETKRRYSEGIDDLISSTREILGREKKDRKSKQNTDVEPKNTEKTVISSSPSFYRKGNYYVYQAKINKNNIDIFCQDVNDRPYRSIESLLRDLGDDKERIVFATNGGMYSPNYVPKGLFIEKGIQKVPIDISKGDPNTFLNFYMMPNGVFYVSNKGIANVCTTDEYLERNPKPYLATQSGPMLLINGKINSYFSENSKHKRVRNGVGIKDDGTVVFILSNEITFYDFANLFLMNGCKNALYLDGVISSMYVKDKLDFYSNNVGPIIVLYE